MSTYKLSKAPMPKIKAGRKPIYPFQSMSKGDMFEVPLDKHDSIRSSILYWGRKLGFKFSLRSTGPSTIGVWRVK